MSRGPNPPHVLASAVAFGDPMTTVSIVCPLPAAPPSFPHILSPWRRNSAKTTIFMAAAAGDLKKKLAVEDSFGLEWSRQSTAIMPSASCVQALAGQRHINRSSSALPSSSLPPLPPARIRCRRHRDWLLRAARRIGSLFRVCPLVAGAPSLAVAAQTSSTGKAFGQLPKQYFFPSLFFYIYGLKLTMEPYNV